MKELIFNDGRNFEVQSAVETEGSLKVRAILTTSEQLKALFLDEFATQKMTLIENHKEVTVFENYCRPSIKEEYGGIWEVELEQKEKGIYKQVEELRGELGTAKEELSGAKQDIETLKESGGVGVDMELFSASVIVARASAQALPDEEALKAKKIYNTFDKLVERGFVAEKEGYKFTDGENLYKTAQDNVKFEAQYRPGTGTESLYTSIDENHAGTIEDPVPYSGNMELLEGKYYIQNETVYKCTRSTGQPVHNLLIDLIGIYVEATERIRVEA